MPAEAFGQHGRTSLFEGSTSKLGTAPLSSMARAVVQGMVVVKKNAFAFLSLTK